MNNVSLCGRLYKDVEVRQSKDGKTMINTGIAVNRTFKNAEGKYDADFISVVAFGATADFISKYFKKGQMIAITGRIQTGSYTNKNNQKVYTTDVVALTAEFTESKGNGNNSGNNTNTSQKQSSQPQIDDNAGFDVNSGFEDASDMELPFN